MKKVYPLICISIFFLPLLFGCSNFVHSIVPSSDNSISGFSLYSGESNVTLDCVVAGDEINIEIDSRYDISNLVPKVEIADASSMIFLTRDCMLEAFPDLSELELNMEYEHAKTKGRIGELGLRLWKTSKNFVIPETVGGLDFSETVYFLVIAQDGEAVCYAVHASESPDVQL